MNKDIIIVGVGGQGILLTSRILGTFALDHDMDIKVSEVHGMSQRGGSVITHVRMGKDVSSPLVDAGKADFVLSFESLEALRAKHYLKADGVLIENTQRIEPMPVIMGNAAYPQAKPETKKAIALDALKLAREAGSQRAVNIVLLGVLSKFFDAPKEAWVAAITACVPQKLLAVNLAAFSKGREA